MFCVRMNDSLKLFLQGGSYSMGGKNHSSNIAFCPHFRRVICPTIFLVGNSKKNASIL